MNRQVMIAASLLACAISTPSYAMSEDECVTAWKVADVDGNGTVTKAEAAAWYAALATSGKTVEDGKLDKPMFIENCKSGLLTVAKTADAKSTDAANAKPVAAAGTETPPLKGANSFTEQQAKVLVMKKGLKDVSALKKDADGIWRGTAADGSKSANIAIDYKGNVVAN